MHIGQFIRNTVMVFGDNLHTLWQCGGNRRIACPLRQVLCYNCTHRSPLCNTSHTVTYTIICTHFYNCRNTLERQQVHALHWVEYLANTQSHHGLCRTTCDQADWITFNFLQFRHHPSSPLVTRPPHAIAIKLYWRCNLHRFHSSRLHCLFGHDPDYSGGERCNQLGR